MQLNREKSVLVVTVFCFLCKGKKGWNKSDDVLGRVDSQYGQMSSHWRSPGVICICPEVSPMLILDAWNLLAIYFLQFCQPCLSSDCAENPY